jgi:hypothetical protein
VSIELDYSAAGAAVRPDLQAAHRALLEYLRRPGSWFNGAERLAIAAEARRAPDCGLCRARGAALSPGHASGEHASDGALPARLVDVIHRVRTDPGRLSRRWFDAALAAGTSPGEYVEAVGITAFTAGLDALCRALGVPAFPWPPALPGEPSRHRPQGLRDGTAWVPLLAPEDACGADADIYSGSDFVPNILRALSLVPDHVRALRAWSEVHYVDVRDFGARRAIDRQQIELVAARVSALNQCFY